MRQSEVGAGYATLEELRAYWRMPSLRSTLALTRAVCRRALNRHSNRLRDYARETGFGAQLHDIRHKSAIERLREGWPVCRVQRYIRDASVKTAERHSFRYLYQEKQEVANAGGNVGL